MPDIFGYIKKKRKKNRKTKKNDTKMELYGLDGVDLVVSYTFFFVTKSANSQPPPASNRYGLTDCYAEKLKIKKPL